MSQSKTLERVVVLVSQSDILISSHGYEELADDDIPVKDILAGLPAAIVVDDYPDYAKGPCVLVMQREIPSMLSGAFRRGHLLRRWLSQLTGPTRIIGRTIF